MKKFILFLSVLVMSSNLCISKDFEFLVNSPGKLNLLISSMVKLDNSIIASSYPGYFYLFNQNQWKYCGSVLGETSDMIVYRDTLYASTENGIYISKDNGRSWSIFTNDIKRASSTSYYDNKIVFCTYNKGLFLSEDYGETWKNLGFKDEYLSSVIIIDSTIFLGNTYGDFVISYNLGKTFEIIPDMYFNNKIRYLNNKVFVSSQNGLYYSSDIGKTWSVPLLPNEYCKDIVYENEKYYVITSSNKLFVSEDLIDWKLIDYPVRPDEDTYCFLVTKDTIYLSNSITGLIKSTNNGESWDVDDLSYNYFWKLMNFDNANILLLNNGDPLLKFNINNNNYTLFPVEDIKTGDILFIDKENEMIVGFFYDSIAVSKDTGFSFKRFKSSKYFSSNGMNFVQIYNKKVYVSYQDGIYLSEDTCNTWKHLGNLNEGAKSVYLSDSLFIAGTYFDGLFSSSNNGISWVKKELNTVGEINAVAIDGNTWYVALGNEYVEVDERGIYISYDNGANWTKSSDLANVATLKFFLYKNVVFAGTYDFGLYLSVDKGKSWEFVGLPNLRVNDLMLKDEYLYAGTNIGLFRAKISDLVSVGEKENIFEPVYLFPNPTENKLSLIEIPVGAVSYEIFDYLGIRRSEGLIEKEIDVSFLPHGVYFLKLNNQVKPIKFMKI